MKEIRIGFVGNVDASKTTSISVLVHGKLDDGRGSARSRIMHYPHEKETGRTSSISRHHIITEEGLISLIDLAGHEKYLKTTLRGLSTHYIDYAVIVVAANMGVSKMTLEHMDIVVAMKIPFLFLVTKIDIPSPSIVKTTVSDIISSVAKIDSSLITRTVSSESKIDDIVSGFEKGEIPIIGISNKTGKNVDLARNFITSLKSRVQFPDLDPDSVVFKIFEKFLVRGVGQVFVGYVTSGDLKPGMKIMLGPVSGNWKSVIIKSIHDNFRNEIDVLSAGESGCVAVRFVDKKNKPLKFKFPKGVVLTNNIKIVEKFEADIYVFTNHSTTIKTGYEPILTCNSICQTVVLYDLEETVIRGGDRMSIKLKFKFRGEYVSEGELFMFREGRVKGIGQITRIL